MSATAVLSPPRATLDDLMKVEGKAELIGGRIVKFMATGRWPATVAFRVAKSLDEYAKIQGGEAHADTVGYAVPELASGRESFSPDASYFVGPPVEDDMDFIAGPPRFAVEVRSKGDYGPAAERKMDEKRDDYFEAGTLAVWDVDPLARSVKLYVPGQSGPTATFQCGQSAHAEPAVPDWSLSVDAIFAK